MFSYFYKNLMKGNVPPVKFKKELDPFFINNWSWEASFPYKDLGLSKLFMSDFLLLSNNLFIFFKKFVFKRLYSVNMKFVFNMFTKEYLKIFFNSFFNMEGFLKLMRIFYFSFFNWFISYVYLKTKNYKLSLKLKINVKKFLKKGSVKFFNNNFLMINRFFVYQFFLVLRMDLLNYSFMNMNIMKNNTELYNIFYDKYLFLWFNFVFCKDLLFKYKKPLLVSYKNKMSYFYKCMSKNKMLL